MGNFTQDVKDLQGRVGEKRDGRFGPLTLAAVNRALDKGAKMPVREPGTAAEIHGLDERTERNIATLDEKVQGNFRKFMRLAKATAASYGCDYVMISGNRTYPEQNELYAKGRTAPGNIVTNARGGYSNHNFGLAGDCGVFKDGAYLDNSDPKVAATVHKACAVHAAECGLEWGGSWSGFKDLPHYEYPVGLSMAGKRAKMAAAGSVV